MSNDNNNLQQIYEHEDDGDYEHMATTPPLPCHTPPRRPRTPMIWQVDTDLMPVVPQQPVQYEEDEQNLSNADAAAVSTALTSSLTVADVTSRHTTHQSPHSNSISEGMQDSVRSLYYVLITAITIYYY